ncbi:transposase [Synechococcus sp. Cruz CV12-2-Slac-r]|uniref:transposase n=1 Tax=Synechococcus sp. Cruz CV12-2-Slac-r TaxID=2823748 RepID=UPI0020CB9F09|nr:transposase [Synechococcus sp. Cruz CV12-2-Slac-r]MCP9940748.1 transposase [Synechococcus sp. Cruz CV12-2-Slac-r]
MILDNLDLNAIQDENARELIRQLLNLVEKLSADLRDAQIEIQRLRDEVNRLKGEQGKPNIKGNTPKPAPNNHSSENERHKSRQRHKKSKNAKIQIDREQVVDVDLSVLPKDAKFKEYKDVVVQDILLRTDNILFHKKKYYAASTGKTYLAKLPRGYEGQFGPGIKALTLAFYYGIGTSEPKIQEFFENVGIQISAGEISNLLIKKQDSFHTEKDALYEAGLQSSPWQQTDDTLTRVDGQNQHCHVVCNPVYTSYHTRASKERLSVLDVLNNGRKRLFRLNEETILYLRSIPWSRAAWRKIQSWKSEQDWEEAAFLERLEEGLPKLSKQQHKTMLDASAVAAYHAQKDYPVVKALICDDAPQFNWLGQEMMLCWVHDGRHYKKLMPVIPLHRELLDDFLKQYWEYYHQLLDYCQLPTVKERLRLETAFDDLFSNNTGYDALDQRIAKTKAKKDSLLLVLQYPELPLHNNASELGVRQRVRKRDVSFGPRTEDGVKSWDTFGTLAETTKKLGLSFYHYLVDRISGTNQIKPLADLVSSRANELNLGWSFLLP